MPQQPTARAARPPRPAGQPRAPEPLGGAIHATRRTPNAAAANAVAAAAPPPSQHPAPADQRPASGPAIRGLKGQKQALPHKPCQTCGRPMSWRKRWARCWDEVRHCSDACRRGTPRHG